ncbi:MAG: hypothetical protein ACHQ4F_15525 [Candidatus Dormibacteria bacterium]
MGNVLIYVEASDGKVAPVTYELLGAARTLAAGLGGQVEALLAGGGALASELGGADTVIHVDHPSLSPYVPEAHVAVLAEAVRLRNPLVVLVGNTTIGIDLAAGAAAATGRPLVSYCVGLEAGGGAVVARSQLYGGKIIAHHADRFTGGVRGRRRIVPGRAWTVWRQGRAGDDGSPRLAGIAAQPIRRRHCTGW